MAVAEVRLVLVWSLGPWWCERSAIGHLGLTPNGQHSVHAQHGVASVGYFNNHARRHDDSVTGFCVVGNTIEGDRRLAIEDDEHFLSCQRVRCRRSAGVDVDLP
jgi:hypothetical protein